MSARDRSWRSAARVPQDGEGGGELRVGIRRLQQSPRPEGIGNLRLMVVIMLSQGEAARHGDHAAALAQRGDERPCAAMTDDIVRIAQDLPHIIERQGFVKGDACGRISRKAALPGLDDHLISLSNPLFRAWRTRSTSRSNFSVAPTVANSSFFLAGAAHRECGTD
jgi:hypothetical protein